MLPTFVIGLREGLEATLIVSIVAAFLRQRGRSDLLKWVFAGIFSAVALCVAGGVILEVISRDLPQKQQEGLETVIGFIAVAMVTYMVVWMRRHSRDLKGNLETAAAGALAAGSGSALVLMAFLAVLREGFETVVFLLAAFNESNNTTSAGLGALLGILVAIVLGYGIYLGGVKLNLSKFFRATGVVLVLVAAGLVASALHTAHEAGWINFGQTQVLDLSSVVAPGSVQSSLVTGILGIQQKPTLVEVVGWLVYLVPVGVYVAWPPGRRLARRVVLSLAGALAAAAVVAGVIVTALTPSGAIAPRPLPVAGGSAHLTALQGSRATVTTPLAGPDGVTTRTVTATRSGNDTLSGVTVDTYAVTLTDPAGAPRTTTLAEISAANGGQLPLGLNTNTIADGSAITVTTTGHTDVTVWIEPRTQRVLDVRWNRSTSAVATVRSQVFPLPSAAATSGGASAEQVSAAADDTNSALDRVDRRDAMRSTAVAMWIIAGLALVAVGVLLFAGRNRSATQPTRVGDRTPSNVG